MERADCELDRFIPLVVAAPNAGVFGVWAYAAVSERFLDSPESFQIFNLTILGGVLASLFGLAYCALGACVLWPRHQQWWLAGSIVSGMGLAINFVGFVLYMGTGC